ncbi:MAG: tetratricopeptide repeat protein [Betaproteobacteria bacterium]|nr:MAG: tetratricopeptide repeat protein [Betaproteobacteria bacterium]
MVENKQMNPKFDLTLVAVDCAYPALAAKALQRSAELLPAARTVLLTDVETTFDGVETIRIAPIKSRAAYSQFMLKQLSQHIKTEFALVVQWDGFVIHDDAFADEFWNYDYIGARWPHVDGEFKVGNGGFSLRSKKLLHALQDDAIEFREDENEDETICIRYRELLEQKHGIVFASERVADRFAFDVSRPVGRTLGFHGVFNFWQVMDGEALVSFARTAPEAIAEGLGFGALTRNLVDLRRTEMAREFVTRRLASLPHDVQALDLKARLNKGSGELAVAEIAIKAPSSRNDPCPCGSGKRYKECHGKVGAANVADAAVNVDAMIGEALQLHQSGNIEAAVDRYTRVLAQEPENPNALHFIGLAQYQSGQPSAALEPMWRSLTLTRTEPEFFSNYSAAAWSAGRYAEGQWAAEHALSLDANHPGALNNLGFNLRSLNQIDASIEAFDRALAMVPDFNYARWNRTFSLLAKADYERGFADYELRLQFPQTQPSGKIPANTPIWRGEPAVGKTILLMCEQGLGDTFMFARFVPMVVARGLTATFAVQKSQVALMQQSFPDVRVIAIGEHEGMQFDYWAALWSLVPALGITLENLPAPKRFLQTSEADVAKWGGRLASESLSRARGRVADRPGEGVVADEPSLLSRGTLTPTPLPPAGEGPRAIGLVWQGQFAGLDNQMADRSIPPRLMSKFIADMSAQHPEINWISLQHGASPLPNENIIDWTNETVEFTQMAALIDALDLVICIDTGAAHLAAALGAETWVLLREAGDWRYGITGETCAWSPTMQLFRQDSSRRWEPVFNEVAAALNERH